MEKYWFCFTYFQCNVERCLQSSFSSLPWLFNFLPCEAHTTTVTFVLSNTVTHQPCPLRLHYSHHLKLLGAQWTHRTASCWAALIETAYVYHKQKKIKNGVGVAASGGGWQNTTSKCGYRTVTHIWPSGLLSHLCIHSSSHMHGPHAGFAHSVISAM